MSQSALSADTKIPGLLLHQTINTDTKNKTEKLHYGGGWGKGALFFSVMSFTLIYNTGKNCSNLSICKKNLYSFFI